VVVRKARKAARRVLAAAERKVVSKGDRNET